MSTWSIALADLLVTRATPASLINGGRRRKTSKQNRTKSNRCDMPDDEIYLLTEEDAYAWFCRARWPETNGAPVCPRCDSKKSWSIPKRRLFKCADCRNFFSVTSGTIWHSRRIGFRKILKVIYKLASEAKGRSTRSIAHSEGLDWKTCHVLTHKIRESLAASRAGLKLSGVVEADCLFFAPSKRPPNRGRGSTPMYHARQKERCVLTLAQRDGPVIAYEVAGETKAVVVEAVRKYLESGATVITDEHPTYNLLRVWFRLKRINHSVEFAKGEISTNDAESFHARVRRAQGVHHRMANGPYLDLYLAEQAFRHSCRSPDIRPKFSTMLSTSLQHSRSDRFAGYWQRHL